MRPVRGDLLGYPQAKPTTAFAPGPFLITAVLRPMHLCPIPTRDPQAQSMPLHTQGQ